MLQETKGTSQLEDISLLATDIYFGMHSALELLENSSYNFDSLDKRYGLNDWEIRAVMDLLDTHSAGEICDGKIEETVLYCLHDIIRDITGHLKEYREYMLDYMYICAVYMFCDRLYGENP